MIVHVFPVKQNRCGLQRLRKDAKRCLSEIRPIMSFVKLLVSDETVTEFRWSSSRSLSFVQSSMEWQRVSCHVHVMYLLLGLSKVTYITDYLKALRSLSWAKAETQFRKQYILSGINKAFSKKYFCLLRHVPKFWKNPDEKQKSAISGTYEPLYGPSGKFHLNSLERHWALTWNQLSIFSRLNCDRSYNTPSVLGFAVCCFLG